MIKLIKIFMTRLIQLINSTIVLVLVINFSVININSRSSRPIDLFSRSLVIIIIINVIHFIKSTTVLILLKITKLSKF